MLPLFFSCGQSSLLSFDDLNKHKEVTSIIEAHVPLPVLEYLRWQSQEDILFALSKPRYLQWLELFCGTGTLSNHFERQLPRGRSLDIAVGESAHDILSTKGFAYMLESVLALVPFAFAWLTSNAIFVFKA